MCMYSLYPLRPQLPMPGFGTSLHTFVQNDCRKRQKNVGIGLAKKIESFMFVSRLFNSNNFGGNEFMNTVCASFLSFVCKKPQVDPKFIYRDIVCRS